MWNVNSDPVLTSDDGVVLVRVRAVVVPAGSTIGYGSGTRLDNGKPVNFVGDWRPMRGLLKRLAVGNLVVVVPTYALGGPGA